jgi:16S rRNA processing protein RimM
MTDKSHEPGGAPEHLIVGQVVAPFGIKGELKVNILTEFPERFEKLEQVTLTPFASIEPGLAPTAALDPSTSHRPLAPRAGSRGPKAPSGRTQFTIESTHIHKGQLLLKLEGVDTADAAEALRGYWLLVPLEEAKKLPRGAYYIYQIVGLDVYTTSGDLVGKIEDVLTTAGNDVYVVRGPGVEDPTGELLVPAIKPVVKRMELKRGRIVIADPKEWS